MDLNQWRQAYQKASKAFATGQYEADSLYLLDDRALLQAVPTVNTETDLFARIDGFTVLAPGWKQCADCPQTIAQIPPADLLPVVQPGHKKLFNVGGEGKPLLANGWSESELWGTWSEETSAEIVFRVPPSARTLRLETTAFLPPGHARQGAVISINGLSAVTTVLDKADGNVIDVNLTEAMKQRVFSEGMLRLQFQFADAVSPSASGLSRDPRKLAMGLKALTVN
jgi:hypothetical protein